MLRSRLFYAVEAELWHDSTRPTSRYRLHKLWLFTLKVPDDTEYFARILYGLCFRRRIRNLTFFEFEREMLGILHPHFVSFDWFSVCQL